MLSKNLKKSKKSLFISLGLSALMFSAAVMPMSNIFASKSYAMDLNPHNGINAAPIDDENPAPNAQWHVSRENGHAILLEADGRIVATCDIDPVTGEENNFQLVNGNPSENSFFLPHLDNDGKRYLINPQGYIILIVNEYGTILPRHHFF